ncbi:MAG: 16S rRNA (cytidine(1402)-2'-O)-methyltransferase, partial [Oscillospiraceae bacterium]
FEIKKPTVSYYEHNLREKGDLIADRIAAGESCALVTDAGMPAISDPGEDLVRICSQRGIEVIAVPGPAACTTALALSGLSTSRFTFEGFLSVNKQSRREHLESLHNESRTMVFYEAPHKLKKTLNDMAESFGMERKISLCRELTKIHEEVIRTNFKDAIKLYENLAPRGEFVLVVEGKAPELKSAAVLDDAVQLARSLMDTGIPPAQAAKESAKITGIKKSDIYKAIV